MLLLDEQPDLSSPAAARQLGQSPSWVRKWRRRWAQEGFGLADGKRPGRAVQYADWVRALVIAVACELPAQRGLALSRHFATSVWRVVSGEGVRISLRTVQRMQLPRFRGHLNAWGEMIAREVSDAENETAVPAGLPR